MLMQLLSVLIKKRWYSEFQMVYAGKDTKGQVCG